MLEFRSRPVFPAIAFLLFTPLLLEGQLQVVETASESFTLGAWIQPVVEARRSENAEDTMGFFLRRARLDARGSVMDGTVRFRVYADFAREPELWDSWMELRRGNLTFRVGQQVVPFHIQREKHQGRAHFADWALPVRRFEVSKGRDVGLTATWRNDDNSRLVGLGAFNGLGADRRALGDHPLVSGRAVAAFGGPILAAETDLSRSPDPVVAVGAGAMFAWQSALKTVPGPATEAAWNGLTADVHARWAGFSAVGSVFRQAVTPDFGAPEYDGSGWFVSAGWVFPGSRVEIALKHGEADLDTGDSQDPDVETGLAVTFFHNGHEARTKVQLLRELTPGGGTGGATRSLFMVIETQLLLGG